jgi:prepilin-type N-terminal cleavage/methylation domain-containing protein
MAPHVDIREQRGFSLVELLVVIVILAVLLAIAIPSLLGFKDRASQKAADADVRASLPAIEALYVDKKTYSSLTLTKIRQSYDAAARFVGYFVPPSDKGQTYCISIQVGSKWAWAQRGKSALQNGDVQESTPAPTCQ